MVAHEETSITTRLLPFATADGVSERDQWRSEVRPFGGSNRWQKARSVVLIRSCEPLLGLLPTPPTVSMEQNLVEWT